MKYALTNTNLLVDLADPDARPLARALWTLIGEDMQYADLRRVLAKLPVWRLIACDGVSAYLVGADAPPWYVEIVDTYAGAYDVAGLFVDRGHGYEPIAQAEAAAIFGAEATRAYLRLEDFDRAAFEEADA